MLACFQVFQFKNLFYVVVLFMIEGVLCSYPVNHLSIVCSGWFLDGDVEMHDSRKLKQIQQAQTIVTNTILCTVCGGAGHIAQDCKERKWVQTFDFFLVAGIWHWCAWCLESFCEWCNETNMFISSVVMRNVLKSWTAKATELVLCE